MVKVLYVLSSLLLLSCATQHNAPKPAPGDYYEITPTEVHTFNQDNR